MYLYLYSICQIIFVFVFAMSKYKPVQSVLPTTHAQNAAIFIFRTSCMGPPNNNMGPPNGRANYIKSMFCPGNLMRASCLDLMWVQFSLEAVRGWVGGRAFELARIQS